MHGYKNRDSTNISLYLGNDARQGVVGRQQRTTTTTIVAIYVAPTGTRMRSLNGTIFDDLERRLTLYFKVAPLFDAEYRRNGTR